MGKTERKGIILILDGLGDRPSDELDGLTALEAAKTPHLDHLVREGMCGMAHMGLAYVPVGTQTGAGLLMGLTPADFRFLTRGPVEAAGVGFTLNPGDVAIRCNFATLERTNDHVGIIDRRAGRIDEHTRELAAACSHIPVREGIHAELRASTQHRAILLLRGPGLSHDISDTDPGASKKHKGLKICKPMDKTNRNAQRTADFVNYYLRKAHQILSEHPVNIDRHRNGLLPANGLLTRGAGTHVPLQNLFRLQKLKVSIVTGEGTVAGLGKLFGFDVIRAPDFSATPDTNVIGKFKAAQEALTNHDLVVVHIKGTDTLSHDRQPTRKARFLEMVDANIPIISQNNAVICVTGDHTTDSNTGRHTGDPVPALLYSPGGRRDGRQIFSEISCMTGGLGQIGATGLICALMDAMGALDNFRPRHFSWFEH